MGVMSGKRVIAEQKRARLSSAASAGKSVSPRGEVKKEFVLLFEAQKQK